MIPYLLGLQNTIKLYHWTTPTYARHIASDQLESSLAPLIDRFVEVYIGKYGRPTLKKEELTMGLVQHTDKSMIDCLEDAIKKLTKETPKDPELLTIRDDMIATIRRALYLFAMK